MAHRHGISNNHLMFVITHVRVTNDPNTRLSFSRSRDLDLECL